MDEITVQNHPPVFRKCHRIVSCYVLPILSLLLLFMLCATITVKFTLERRAAKMPHSSITPLPISPTIAPYPSPPPSF
jgi:hypothetical protein